MNALGSKILKLPEITDLTDCWFVVAKEGTTLNYKVNSSLIGGGGGGGCCNLQDTTDIGNQTTNSIECVLETGESVAVMRPDPSSETGVFKATKKDSLRSATVDGNGYLSMATNTDGFEGRFSSTNLLENQYLEFPRTDGVLVVSVNGILADLDGNIVIDTGGGGGCCNLQDTTDIGNSTTNPLNVVLGADIAASMYIDDDLGMIKAFAPGGLGGAFINGGGHIGIIDEEGISAIISATHLDDFCYLQLPMNAEDATLALSVNGVFADWYGDIYIPGLEPQDLQSVTDIGNVTTKGSTWGNVVSINSTKIFNCFVEGELGSEDPGIYLTLVPDSDMAAPTNPYYIQIPNNTVHHYKVMLTGVGTTLADRLAAELYFTVICDSSGNATGTFNTIMSSQIIHFDDTTKVKVIEAIGDFAPFGADLNNIYLHADMSAGTALLNMWTMVLTVTNTSEVTFNAKLHASMHLSSVSLT